MARRSAAAAIAPLARLAIGFMGGEKIADDELDQRGADRAKRAAELALINAQIRGADAARAHTVWAQQQAEEKAARENSPAARLAAVFNEYPAALRDPNWLRVQSALALGGLPRATAPDPTIAARAPMPRIGAAAAPGGAVSLGGATARAATPQQNAVAARHGIAMPAAARPYEQRVASAIAPPIQWDERSPLDRMLAAPAAATVDKAAIAASIATMKGAVAAAQRGGMTQQQAAQYRENYAQLSPALQRAFYTPDELEVLHGEAAAATGGADNEKAARAAAFESYQALDRTVNTVVDHYVRHLTTQYADPAQQQNAEMSIMAQLQQVASELDARRKLLGEENYQILRARLIASLKRPAEGGQGGAVRNPFRAFERSAWVPPIASGYGTPDTPSQQPLPYDPVLGGGGWLPPTAPSGVPVRPSARSGDGDMTNAQQRDASGEREGLAREWENMVRAAAAAGDVPLGEEERGARDKLMAKIAAHNARYPEAQLTREALEGIQGKVLRAISAPGSENAGNLRVPGVMPAAPPSSFWQMIKPDESRIWLVTSESDYARVPVGATFQWNGRTGVKRRP